jgi:hypothetical protein
MLGRVGAATVLMSMFVGPAGGVAAAQDESSSRPSFTPYAWVFGMKGRIGTGDSAFDVDLSPGELIDQVDVAFSLVLEAKRGRWFGRFDGTFLSASDREEVQGASDVVLEIDQGMGQPEIGYEVMGAPWGGIDLFAGARIWRLNAEVNTSGDGEDVEIASGDRTWADGVGGIRVRYNPAPKWRLFARGDAGAGGSNLSWQALGGGGFDFSDCCGAVLAYRHLDVDYDHNGVINDTSMSGFTLGIEIRF